MFFFVDLAVDFVSSLFGGFFVFLCVFCAAAAVDTHAAHVGLRFLLTARTCSLKVGGVSGASEFQKWGAYGGIMAAVIFTCTCGSTIISYCFGRKHGRRGMASGARVSSGEHFFFAVHCNNKCKNIR